MVLQCGSNINQWFNLATARIGYILEPHETSTLHGDIQQDEKRGYISPVFHNFRSRILPDGRDEKADGRDGRHGFSKPLFYKNYQF